MMSARCSLDNHDYFVHEAGWHGRVHSQMLEVSPEGCSGASLAKGAGGAGAEAMSLHPM